LRAESQIVHHVPQLPVLRAVPVIKEFYFRGNMRLLKNHMSGNCLKNIQMQNAQKPNRGAYLLLALQRTTADECFIKAFLAFTGRKYF
jgi:hypothetical protein